MAMAGATVVVAMVTTPGTGTTGGGAAAATGAFSMVLDLDLAFFETSIRNIRKHASSSWAVRCCEDAPLCRLTEV